MCVCAGVGAWPGNLERSDILSLGSDVGSLVQQTFPGNGVVEEPHEPGDTDHI